MGPVMNCRIEYTEFPSARFFQRDNRVEDKLADANAASSSFRSNSSAFSTRC